MNSRYLILCRTGYEVLQHRINGQTVIYYTFEDAQAAAKALNHQAMEDENAASYPSYARMRTYWVQETA